jgi:hypothetical protein
MKTSFVTTEIRIVAISGRGLMLGYICRGWQRWCGQQRTIDNHWLKKGIVKKLMRKRWLWTSAYERDFALVGRLVTKSLNSPWRTRNTYKLKRLTNRLNLLFLFN